MSTSLVSTGLQFPSGSIQTVADPLPYKQIPILMSEYQWNYQDSTKWILPNNTMTKLKLGSLAQAPAIWGDAEFDPTNNVWRIKKAGYYYFNVGVQVVHQYETSYNYAISKFRIHFCRNGIVLASEQENGWYVFDSYPAYTSPYPRSLAKDCNFNAYCNVDDEFAIYGWAEAAYPGYYGQVFMNVCIFSGHMLRT